MIEFLAIYIKKMEKKLSKLNNEINSDLLKKKKIWEFSKNFNDKISGLKNNKNKFHTLYMKLKNWWINKLINEIYWLFVKNYFKNKNFNFFHFVKIVCYFNKIVIIFALISNFFGLTTLLIVFHLIPLLSSLNESSMVVLCSIYFHVKHNYLLEYFLLYIRNYNQLTTEIYS